MIDGPIVSKGCCSKDKVQPKNIKITHEIKRLETLVERLDNLIAKVQNNPVCDEEVKEELPNGLDSLSALLDDGSKVIEGIGTQIHDRINTLDNLLF